MIAAAASQRRAMAVLVAVSIVAAGLGFLAGQTTRTPADVASEATAPEPSLITVPVELRELSSNVVVRGDALREGSQQLLIDRSAGADDGGVAVVTGLSIVVGDRLSEGDVMLEVGERPVILLRGQLPMFRTLVPGSRGDDVTQVQEALARLGFDVAVTGIYGEQTEAAVELFYSEIGYAAPGISDDERRRLVDARVALDDAQASLNLASAALAELKAPLPRSERLEIDAALRSAEAAVARTSATAAEANALAEQDIAARRAERTDAGRTRDAARARQDDAKAGVHPDTGLEPTEEELAALAADLDIAEGALASAEAAVTAAAASIARVAAEQAELVDAAEAQLEIARARRSEALAAPDTKAAVEAEAAARKIRDRTAAEVSAIEARVGVRLPVAEIIFVESLPTRVEQLNVQRGDIVDGPVMAVSSSAVTIVGSLSVGDRPLVAEGAAVRVDDEELGIDLAGTVSYISDSAVSEFGSDGRYFFSVVLDDPAGQDIEGLNLRVTIPIESTGGEVLAVPLAALVADAGGSVRVDIEDPEEPGSTRSVSVATGLATAGYVEIRPLDGEIRAGDRVVVGQQ